MLHACHANVYCTGPPPPTASSPQLSDVIGHLARAGWLARVPAWRTGSRREKFRAVRRCSVGPAAIYTRAIKIGLAVVGEAGREAEGRTPRQPWASPPCRRDCSGTRVSMARDYSHGRCRRRLNAGGYWPARVDTATRLRGHGCHRNSRLCGFVVVRRADSTKP